MAVNAEHRRGPRTYGHWQRPKSAGLMGLGSVGTGMLFGGLVIVVLTLMFAGLIEAFVMAAGLGLLLLVLLTKDKHGRSTLARIGARVAWLLGRSRGAHLYRSGPLGRAPWGTYQPPGLAASIRLSEHTDSYGRAFALLHTPSTGHFAVVIGTEPDGAALVDEEQIDEWVADWGGWLANSGEEPGVVGVGVTIETAPDTGTRLRREVNMNLDDDGPEFARAVMQEVVGSYPVGSSVVRGFVTVTFSAATRAGGKKRSAEEMGRDLAARLPGLTAALESTGAGAAHPLSAQEFCEAIRIAYDPAAGVLIDEARANGEVPEMLWPDVGPTAHQANWDSLRHDSALSVTWAMSSAPRGLVQSRVLARLLAPHRDIDRKRVTILYRPVDPATAAAIVEADLRAAQFLQTSTKRPSARAVMATRAAQATAQEEASGAGLVNFAMLVTATVNDASRAADAVAAIDSLAATARLRLRVVNGSQDSAFAAALPLGIVVPDHLRVPKELREKL